MPRKSKCLQCDKSPCWKNPKGKFTHCGDHANKTIMIEKPIISIKRCECGKPAIWKYQDKIYCDTHKKDDMAVRMKVYVCIACEIKPAYFGIKPYPTHCSGCNKNLKLGFTDTVSVKCKDCKIVRASFKFLDTKGYTHCTKCKLPGMFSTKPKCDECKVKPKVAIFGIPGKYPTRCKEHKDEKTMIDVAHAMCDKCNIKRPTFGVHQPTRCFPCKDIDMKDVANPLCLFCNVTRAIPKYNHHCHKCYYELNPDAPRTRYFGLKESSTIKYIKKMFNVDHAVLNKHIKGGASSYRPDIYIDYGSHVIIIEIDEHQHKSYVPNPDRDAAIHQDIGRPVHIIHFNPDQYDDVKSPWFEDKVVAADWNVRLHQLAATMDICIDAIPVGLNSIKLYYDR